MPTVGLVGTGSRCQALLWTSGIAHRHPLAGPYAQQVGQASPLQPPRLPSCILRLRTLAQPAASSVAATFSFSLINTVPNSLPPACSSV